MRRFVVNASPLILLSRIDRLDLLTKLADEVVVPEAVREEVLAGAEQNPEVRSLPVRFRVVEAPVVPVEIERWDLGPGESSVLAVALGWRVARRSSTISRHDDAPRP